MYVFRYRLSLFRPCGNDFGITPVDGITDGITWAVFCFHIAHISFAIFRYLFCLSVIVLARLCVLLLLFWVEVEVDYILFICTVWLLVAWSQNCVTKRVLDSVTSMFFHLIEKSCTCFPVTGQIKSRMTKNGYVRTMISRTKEYVFIVCVMWRVGRRNFMD
jgi:hypothetical protein